MSYKITAYSKTAYQEFLLPGVENADETITFYREVFGIKKDVTVSLEVVNGKWHFKPSRLYSILMSGESYFNHVLESQDILDLRFPDGNVISLIVWESQQSFSVFTKLDVSRVFSITVGKSEQSDIVFDILGLISRHHMTLYFQNGGCVLEDDSKNGVYVNSFRVNGSVQLSFGDEINLFGIKMIWLGTVLAVNWNHVPVRINQAEIYEIAANQMKYYATEPNYADFSGGETGTISGEHREFQRAPRNIVHLKKEPVEIEQPPQKAKEDEKSLFMTIGPSLTMAVPMILGSGLAILGTAGSGMSGVIFMYTGLITAISAAVIGAIWAGINFKASGRQTEENEKKRWQTYGEYLEHTEKKIAADYAFNREALENLYPSAAVVAMYTDQTLRLWNRNPSQEDFLSERLGIGTVPFQVPIRVQKQHFTVDYDPLKDRPEEIRRKYQKLEEVPVCIDLKKNGLIGVIGGSSKTGAYQIARILMTQIAANNSYTDVKMALICNRKRGEEKELFEGAKWFPHFWSDNRRSRYTADNPVDASSVFFELTDVVRRRAEETQQRNGSKSLPHIVLFLIEPDYLEGELLEKYAMNPKPEYGLTTILFVSAYEQLPNSCNFIVSLTDGFEGYYTNAAGEESLPVHIHFDDVERESFRAFSRRLANIRVRENVENGEIPDTVTFLDMYHVHHLSELQIKSRWAKNRSWESMKAVIGVMGGGKNCYLDINEKYHGPHGLVAGTTGSGKSETLQTFILSLAINFSPEDVAFFIIDYKGGGMGGLFTGLPHLAGQISNLSGNQIRRAMISIKSENQRRQRIFREYGVNHIDQYTQLYKNKEADEPIPHLLIIIDEFAELKREQPEFMQELVSVAQVGRSLGVHLILSTQRPAGTVDDNIWGNTKFRLCLRVQNRQDSMDMLHKPDAAYLTQTGRCYLQVGNDELYELFQSGWSGVPYDEEDNGSEQRVQLLTCDGKAVFNRRTGKKGREKKAPTQLEAVTKYLADVSESAGYRTGFSIWRPVLPSRSYLNGIGRLPWPKHKDWSLTAEIGQIDDPAHQAQFPLEVNFGKDGNTAVLGTVACGKSTFLQGLVASLISRYDPSWVNLYLIDFSSHMLECFEKAPHVGGLMNEDTSDRIRKFFRMMSEIMEERRKILKGGNYEQYVASAGVQMPAILIVIDQYVSFREKTNEAYTEILTRIAREGINYGMFLVMTAPGFGFSGIDRSVGDNMNNVICLEMKDRYEYAEALHTTKLEILPEKEIRGRGLVRVKDAVLEFQTSLSLPADNDYERSEKLRGIAEKMAKAWQGHRARRVPEIPLKPGTEEFFQVDEVQEYERNPKYLPVGYRSEDASVYAIDLAEIFCFLITGENRSGKTNFLKVLLQSAALKHAEIYVFDQSGHLARNASAVGAAFLTSAGQVFSVMKNLIPEFSKRHKIVKQLIRDGYEDQEIFDKTGGFRPIIFLIDNLNDFINEVEQVQDETAGLTEFLENMTDKGRMHGIYFFAAIDAGSPEPIGSPVFENMTREKKGIRFGGNAGSDEILSFSYLSFSEAGKKTEKGIGLLPDGNEDSKGHSVVIPLARGIEKT